LLRRWEEKMEEKMYNGLPKNQPKQIEGSR